MAGVPTSAVPPGPPDVSLLFGPLLIGVCLNCILYGILVLQVVIYFVSYRKDPAWIRYFVLYLIIVESVNVGCNIATIYEPLVLRFGTPAALTFFPIMITSTPVTNVAISTPVQMFTAWRIVVITRKKIVGLIISTFSLVSLGFAVYTAVVITNIRKFELKGATVKPATVWFITSVCADAIITATLYFSLSRRRTGFKSTDVIINRIIRLTLQTGMLTFVFAISETITFLVSPNTTANFTIDFPLSKLYTNALLSTLNARLSWRKLANTETPDGEDDNVLFGRPGDSQISRVSHNLATHSGLSHRVSGAHSQGRRPNRGNVSFMDYELESRGPIDHDNEDFSEGLPKVHIHKEIQRDYSPELPEGPGYTQSSYTQ